MLVALHNHTIMITTLSLLHTIFIFTITITLTLPFISTLNPEGLTLLSLKHSLNNNNNNIQPPLLQNWNSSDPNPCSWSGVTCAPQNGPVVTLLLPNSHLTGPLPTELAHLQHLRILDLSNNSLNGTIPISVLSLSSLEKLSLASNFISGELPEIFSPLESLQLLNLSNNKLSGSVFQAFAENIPVNAVVDLSFNNFSGEIPQVLSGRKSEYFVGNEYLCGKPLKKACMVLSTHSFPPNVSSDGSANAAIAAIPKRESGKESRRRNSSWKIVAVVVGDFAAVVILIVVFIYTYRLRKIKKESNEKSKENVAVKIKETGGYEYEYCSCFGGGVEEESEAATEMELVGVEVEKGNDDDNDNDNNKCLVMVDGETELETETLLKASAYVLGSSNGRIVYKAVVGGGEAFAVRRIGECGVEKMKDFEKIVRGLSKFRHPNLVKVLGFYWGEDEKLVIYDYISNGNLATAVYEKAGSSSRLLSFETRLKIAKGIAKGLSYIHEKKHVHGNMKPNNILLTSEMDPVISDFGLEWLISGKVNYALEKSTVNFGRRRSTSSSHDETMINHAHNHHPTNNNTYVALPSNSLYGCVTHPQRLMVGCVSPYQAPELVKTLKYNPKWDVYSFGIILLELLTGKIFTYKELADLIISGMETKISKIMDEFTIFDVHGRQDCFLTCLKLGLTCASMDPHKRPSMKEALQVLEKIPCPS